ncbi:ABC transporter ATP-binding protein [Rhodospirillum rubrum]|uniref:Lipoprotein-releasing system ATP-binding protein LolD 1 n=1 Tax=Rhodospirillum rubrum (strain ATCC 11170 / ATH 1.1.1 / DSM 467 / LMG 4362 / NCIMB 8255 / S1) TaxID=269796 RepID=LOLD1_RHORT|nr:RecName: Full=Lipoprotein-releasing system ATP-binding protein LolD 1 [Rhodospirillum rubrum ATCC 11170]QXG82375.1 ABC transporter ATP-binding protein [Rhodospirillum rubrum]
MPQAALRLDKVTRSFSQGREVLNVLTGADLAVNPGEIVALVGPSGAGKSTLLQICGLLEKPTAGEVRIGGISCGQLSEDRRTLLRRDHLGFVYQYHHLLPEFSAAENIVVPQMIAGIGRKPALARAAELLAKMGLSERQDHRPGQLSGGEQQRVAICRALANRPKLLLADEPTGNLDPNTAERVFQALLDLVRGEGLAALIATHNPDLARRMDRIVTLREGKVVAA